MILSNIPLSLWPFVGFIVSWIILAMVFKSKRTAERASVRQNLPGRLLMLASFIIIFFVAPLSPAGIIPQVQNLYIYAGFAIEAMGLAFMIWARIILGRNWSMDVVFKKNHQLIMAGPYRIVRHPIYTGVIALFLGAAIYSGIWLSLAAPILCFLGLLFKSRSEEELLSHHFKNYAQYRKKVKAIIPFVY
ncbi:MAG: isoprenylcysteine carboxylmethyltransferase family protein [Candidatus Micrarchaeota archaeon]|nr:isoprenylcysteine carboxylmethyltransferase family protein [Candidatus Micrarchaeota archaeon]